MAIIEQLDGRAVAVFHGDRPAFYIVAPAVLEQLRTLQPDPAISRPMPLPSPDVEAEAAAQSPAAPAAAEDNGGRIEQLAERLVALETQRHRRGELCKAAVGILRNRLDAHVLPFFASLHSQQVTSDLLDEFLEYLTARDLSPTTISQYFVIVRKLLKLAVRLGHLQSLPELPRVRIANRPRSMLTVAEYRVLVRTARRRQYHRAQAPQIKDRGGERERFWVYPRNLTLAPDMAWVIGFMINSFVRPSDIRNLRHKHVQVIRAEHTYLRLTLPESKRHDLPVVTMTPAVRIYEAALRRGQAIGKAGPDDYVFLPEEKDRAYVLAVLGFWFKWVMREADVPRVDHLDRQRTLYSLRHTAIMFRMLYGEGIDMLTLARNARTSVQMIERFLCVVAHRRDERRAAAEPAQCRVGAHRSASGIIPP